MSGKIEISRELAERLLNFTCNEEYDELRALLAAPVIERQPAAWIVTDMNGDSYFAYDKQTPNDEPLYVEQPEPVAVVLPDADQFIEDVLGLSTRRLSSGDYQSFGAACAARAIEKVKELNQ